MTKGKEIEKVGKIEEVKKTKSKNTEKVEKVEKTPITIDGAQYFVEDFDERQRQIFNHLIDLENKLNTAKYNVDQLQVGRDAFFNMLKTSLQPAQEPAN